MSSVTNALGYIVPSQSFNNVECVSVNNVEQQFVLVGDTGDLTAAAIGTHAFNALGTAVALQIPAGFEVYKSELRVVVAPTTGGASTISLGTNGAGNAAVFNTDEGVAQFTLTGNPQYGDVSAVFTNSATVNENVILTLAADALTAGQLIIYLSCRHA